MGPWHTHKYCYSIDLQQSYSNRLEYLYKTETIQRMCSTTGMRDTSTAWEALLWRAEFKFQLYTGMSCCEQSRTSQNCVASYKLPYICTILNKITLTTHLFILHTQPGRTLNRHFFHVSFFFPQVFLPHSLVLYSLTQTM